MRIHVFYVILAALKCANAPFHAHMRSLVNLNYDKLINYAVPNLLNALHMSGENSFGRLTYFIFFSAKQLR